MTASSAGLTIENRGTPNPVLFYNGKPMLKVGPMPEVHTFALPWNDGNPVFNHGAWTRWMLEHGMGYGRVYPESGYAWCSHGPDAGKIVPFVVDHWDGVRPVVDLTRFDEAYWEQFANTIRQCREREIVLHLQLYQLCYFQGDRWLGESAWKKCYFNPANNVNGFELGGWDERSKEENGLDYFGKVVEQYPDGALWKIHEQWVRHILNAIGDSGNVIIDLINEGNYHTPQEWVDKTLDVIDAWKARTGNAILVGAYKHFWAREYGKDWILGHPRLDVLIDCGFDVRAGTTGPDRITYQKPVISVHNHWLKPEERPEGYSPCEVHGGYPFYKRIYQWLAMMQKVQGIGVYGKAAGATSLDSEHARAYAAQTKFLMHVFEGLKDFAHLVPCPEKIVGAPGDYRHLLASPAEVLVYLATKQMGETVPAGQEIELRDLNLPDGELPAQIIDPAGCTVADGRIHVSGGRLTIELPRFTEDVAVCVKLA
ncbi:MAG: hypothetical protein JXR37_19345 [Kiritimatiellae bacterium]|nr:hypothetical protein [Kiritimatiellia bacterium]